MSYYIKVGKDGIIKDALTYPYADYIKYDGEIPDGVYGGWHKYENGEIIEHPELKPEDPFQIQLEELKKSNAELIYQLMLKGVL